MISTRTHPKPRRAAAPPPSGADLEFATYELRVLRSLRKIMRVVDLHSRAIHTRLRITLPQLLCLHALHEQDGLPLQALSRAVNLSSSTVNGIVDRLETKALITRNRHPKDRRRLVLALTPRGRRLVRSAPALLQDRFAEALRRLPELEQATITLSLERVVGLMDAQHLDASPNLLPAAILDDPTQGSPP
ncbi:MAG: MarR family transcriptional regulator [Lentisphaerae bacterium]|nr:MarR family transcriptional regulator [Lentisphaerota bacterium]